MSQVCLVRIKVAWWIFGPHVLVSTTEFLDWICDSQGCWLVAFNQFFQGPLHCRCQATWNRGHHHSVDGWMALVFMVIWTVLLCICLPTLLCTDTNRAQMGLMEAGRICQGSVLYGNDACTSNNDASDTSKSTNDAQCRQQQWYKTGYEYYKEEAKCQHEYLWNNENYSHHMMFVLSSSLLFLMHRKHVLQGIERVSKGSLLPSGFSICDLAEPLQCLLSHAPQYIGSVYAEMSLLLHSTTRLCTPARQIQYHFHTVGYRVFDRWGFSGIFEAVWSGLTMGGIMVIKDIMCTDMTFIADRGDASVTRSLPYILAIVKLAGVEAGVWKVSGWFSISYIPGANVGVGTWWLKCVHWLNRFTTRKCLAINKSRGITYLI